MDNCPACGLSVKNVPAHMRDTHKSRVEDWLLKPSPEKALSEDDREVQTESGVIVVRKVPNQEGGYL